MTSVNDMPADIVEAADNRARELFSKLPGAFRMVYVKDLKKALAEAILAERQRVSAVRRLTPEQAAAAKQMIAEGNGFADTDPEARFIADGELSCPHCGGSGHKDDVRDQWQHIETAPTDGTHILIWDELNKEVSVAFFNRDVQSAFTGWFHKYDWLGGARFSLWQPLPAPPKGGAA
jgi:hypothetical protein